MFATGLSEFGISQEWGEIANSLFKIFCPGERILCECLKKVERRQEIL